ncbi:MAG: hypothetical protein K2M14_02565, partial [Muribaculaceae bacterium]|nr:hypothetical protein [Muribaculaceae bacterium]
LDADLLPEGTTISRINLSVHRSSDDSEVGNLWNAIDRNIAPADFYKAFGTPFTLSKYAETYYNDLFDYQSSGYYYYKMTVTFKTNGQETSETVTSNPFYVSIAPSTLVAAQLVEIVRDENGKAVEERFDDYQYVTYTPGSPYEWGYLTDEAFARRKANFEQEEGRDATGLGRYGYRVEKINMNPTSTLNRQFYADADRATWTNKVLVYSLRPWKGEDPDMNLVDAGAHGAYWEIVRDGCRTHETWENGPNVTTTWYYGHVAEGTPGAQPTLSGDGKWEGHVENLNDLLDRDFDSPMEWILDATCIYEHNFTVKLHYYPTAEETELTAESSVSHDDMQLRIPTPRMRPVAFSGTMEDLSVEGENYGEIEIAAEDHTGNKTDNIAYGTNVYDNPRVRTLRFGAYMDMPNATPELIALIPDLGAKATDEQKAAGMMGNYWRKCEIDCAEDEGFEELLDGSWLNIKDMRYTRFRFLNQDLNYWLTYNSETNKYEPIERNITFDFEYDPTGNGEILFFPRRAAGVTFNLQSNLKAPKFVEKEGNIDATAYKVVIPKTGADNAMEEHLILSDVKTQTDTESTISLPGEYNFDEPQEIEFTLNEDKAYYMFLLDKSLPV